jgi:hypothetical protein
MGRTRGRPQLNWSVVPGPETISLVPRGVSYLGGSRWTNRFLRGADRIHLISGVGIPERNQRGEPRTGY